MPFKSWAQRIQKLRDHPLHSPVLSKLRENECENYNDKITERCKILIVLQKGMWLSGRAFALHVKGPGISTTFAT